MEATNPGPALSWETGWPTRRSQSRHRRWREGSGALRGRIIGLVSKIPVRGSLSAMIEDGSGGGGQVRLAELVAALSLGVDLGFGQPMEHVLRECLIALRLAERAGLDDGERSVVYYTALLVNVGCHSDAHEQAKWFGDDIALKGTKYKHEQRSLAAAAATMRLVGSGNPPLHRFRVGL